jgi:hypothetical protein
MDSERILYDKLEKFIRKYYLNQLIRGMILIAGLLAVCLLIVLFLEYLIHFKSTGRAMLFFVFVIIGSGALGFLVLVPAIRLAKIGRNINQIKASQIIGAHFDEIEDKLLNALQLIQQVGKSPKELPLLLASIEQKTNTIRIFDFTKVISLRKNLRYVPIVAPPLILILIGLIAAPGVVKGPADRIVNYNREYSNPQSFTVEILNKALTVYQQEDFQLRIKVTGEEIPDIFSIEMDSRKYTMRKEKGSEYSYLFRAVQGNKTFEIQGGTYTSQRLTLQVFPKPMILSFTVELIYPEYTRKGRESIENTGDLIVPEGTEINWTFTTRDVSYLKFIVDEKQTLLSPDSQNTTRNSIKCNQTFTYILIPENKYNYQTDSIKYKVTVLADNYPSIRTAEERDSIIRGRLFFSGEIRDDYGFSRLVFHYETGDPFDTVILDEKNIELTIRKTAEDRFLYSTDFSEWIGKAGESIRYYFEVWDNDGINGPKATRSELREFRPKTLDELETEAGKRDREIQSDLEQSLENEREVKQSIEELKAKLAEQTNVQWRDNEKIKNILQHQEELINEMEKIKLENLKNIENDEKYLETSQNILEKQKRLNELMELMLTDEMKERLAEMKALLNQLDKDKLNQMLENLKLNAKELEEQLDRNLQLFKDIEFSRKLENVIKDLRKAAEEQRMLKDSIEKSEGMAQKEIEKQKEVSEKFDSIRGMLNKLAEQEKEEESPIGIKGTEGFQDSISRTQSNAELYLQQKKKKEALKNQERAADMMKQLAEQLESMQEDAEMEESEEDVTQVRKILENLITISFEQEELMERCRKINRNDPRFQAIITEQKEMQEKLQSAKDSLIAIGRRQFILQPVITREITAVNENISKTIDALNTRSMGMVQAKQQYTMTALNNLALLLDETVDQMNQNMSLQMQGKSQKMCKNPSSGSGKKNIKNIRQLQQKLSEQMKMIKEGLEKQQQGKKPQGKTGKIQINEELARLAAEQEAIRRELQKYGEMLIEKGEKNTDEIKNAAEEMEKNERELINKIITRETLIRQQKILSRLLEAEKAEQLRDQKEERESNEAKNAKTSNPEWDLEYKRILEKDRQLLNYKILPVNRFYKEIGDTYKIKIED